MAAPPPPPASQPAQELAELAAWQQELGGVELGECNLLSKWEQLWKSYGTVVEHKKKNLGTVVECTAM